ncbi:2-oxoglutarate dehydrogenase, E2 component, dihydrolipoamide succinyltransferase [Rubrivirga litoralis]|uniref:Dihydrolipoamide acetyltransferase component of pyruvate dehydrogenase complex n=1 Tax=Rubrivirga litoralis TaxID=3075598 RepID=A0ABU3BM60_9BACT|nr:2-oxoglutarate dehydrogenase, E2 component, dihydrolipoamide succinyltransferase [Rubrivirga sp. F394]MDT0630367.1 2-oxoglutarate dehydrogenase, E2 component, dihydrolipoamide succinyltransferase [Rubrivirga sp. F394]
MARVDVVMPKMGESVMEGTVLEWKKAVGDTVEQDETLLEISTDKVDSEVPSPEAGRIAEILVQENDTVEVGTPIAVIETDVNADLGGGSDAVPPAEDSAVEEAAEPYDETHPVGEDPAVEPEAKPAAPIVRPVDGGGGDATPPAPGGSGGAASGGAAGGGARTEVVMPKMGESVMEGTVLEWKKAVGDTVEQDETLLEISTDKVDSEVPSPEAGTLLEILVQEGDTVDVGTPIAVIGSGAAASGGGGGAGASGDGASDVPEPYEKSYSSAPNEATAAAAPAVREERGAEAAARATAGDGGPIPRRDDAGNFYSPLVRSIAETEGLSLSELQSITGSGQEGRVTKADVMGFLESRGGAGQPAETPQPKSYNAEGSGPETSAAQAAPPRPAARQAPAAPRTRAQAAEASAETGDRVEVIEMNRMRQLIADHMRRSKDTSAHVTSFSEVDVTGLVQHREAHKAAFQEREGIKLTYTPYFVEAAIEPLRDHPLLNSSVEGTRILVKKDFNVGVAVAVGTKGLLVPVIRNAGQQNLTGLAHTVSDLAERARTKKLQPDELQGGTFTVTNVGSLGSLMGTPIINQPQSAILSPGAIVKRPVVIEVDGQDVIAIRQMMYVSLSYDHRIIDGAMAASFLAAYRAQLEAIGPDSTLL